MAEIRIDDMAPVCVTVSEDYDGGNPPAAVTLIVRELGRGRFSIDLIGGDPEREGEDTDKPTLLDGTYDGDKRTFEGEGPQLHHLVDLVQAVAMGNTEADALEAAADRVLNGGEPFPDTEEERD